MAMIVAQTTMPMKGEMICRHQPRIRMIIPSRMKTSIAVRVESADEEVFVALPLGGVLVSLMLMGPLRADSRSVIIESTPC
jgi:sensor c-di-GMP phosphodiesterase-like protein